MESTYPRCSTGDGEKSCAVKDSLLGSYRSFIWGILFELHPNLLVCTPSTPLLDYEEVPSQCRVTPKCSLDWEDG